MENSSHLFNKYWTAVSDTLVQLGLDQLEIDRLRNAPLDEESFIDLLKKWKIQDDYIKEQLEIVNKKLDVIISKASDIYFQLKKCIIETLK